MDFQAQTNNVYNKYAENFKIKFHEDGLRTDDIELALTLAGNRSGAHVVELGCGTGRDAAEIIKRVGWYEGIDPAAKMIDIARAHVPDGRFVVSDATHYHFPSDLDVVFAFASLLHVDNESMKDILAKVARALRPGGIFYMRLREKDAYAAEIQTDEYGDRMYYYYNPQLLSQYAGNQFELVHTDRDYDSKRSIKWFGVALKRR